MACRTTKWNLYVQTLSSIKLQIYYIPADARHGSVEPPLRFRADLSSSESAQNSTGKVPAAQRNTSNLRTIIRQHKLPQPGHNGLHAPMLWALPGWPFCNPYTHDLSGGYRGHKEKNERKTANAVWQGPWFTSSGWLRWTMTIPCSHVATRRVLCLIDASLRRLLARNNMRAVCSHGLDKTIRPSLSPWLTEHLRHCNASIK